MQLKTTKPTVQDVPHSATKTPPGCLVVREWTGREAVALRKALRMTEARFARAVGVSPRTVANWHAKPDTVPRNAAQDLLDELLDGASAAVVDRFERFAGQPAEPGRAPSGDLAALVAGARDACAAGESGGQVVRLGTHPRYAAEFKPLACGQVAAARTALGLTLREFAALLESALGWVVMPEAAGRWETESVPPGDVVLFCQAFLTDAHGFPVPAAQGRDELTARRAARRRR